jgi:hypothetical protein
MLFLIVYFCNVEFVHTNQLVFQNTLVFYFDSDCVELDLA